MRKQGSGRSYQYRPYVVQGNWAYHPAPTPDSMSGADRPRIAPGPNRAKSREDYAAAMESKAYQEQYDLLKARHGNAQAERTDYGNPGTGAPETRNMMKGDQFQVRTKVRHPGGRTSLITSTSTYPDENLEHKFE